MLKSAAVTILLSIFPFMSVNIYFYTFRLVFYERFVLLWIDPFINIKCPSLSLVTALVLKSILSDTSVATPALFLFPFACNTLSHPVPFSLGVFQSEVSLL